MHSRRSRFRRTLALLTGSLLAGTSLTLAAPEAVAAPAVSVSRSTAAADFQQVTLAKGVEETGEPMSLAVLPDRSVLHTARDGTVRLTDAGGTTTVAGRLAVYTHDEEGLQGVGVDPAFADNRFVYLFYAPLLDTPAGDAPENGTAADFAPFDGVNRLSRFILKEDGTLDLSSEKNVLEVKTSRGTCCHVGGDIDFDADGNLYLSTGDDTNPFASDGFSPIDERASRNPAFDAQRSAGNSNDLRGKVLRIKVNQDGSYAIPEGNLFPPGTDKTRPEIYAMGFRNPFRISVDKTTGIVYVGDYGPDAGAADPARGPGGQVEFARVTGPGNFGWPYCTGKNDAFVDYDFATGDSGAAFDCGAPENTSPNNTGITALPPAQEAWIPYDGGSVPEFGTGSESPMAGPVYRYDADLDSTVKFPEEYDGDFFAGEFGRQWIKRIEQDDDGTVQSINDVPWAGTQVMDMAFGPDGALYVLDYGTGYFNGDENSALYRIENATGGHAPTVEADADTTSGVAPLKVSFTSTGSDADGEDLSYGWDFGDGTTGTGADAEHTYDRNGSYTATVTAEDPTGRTGTASVHVVVGNTAPTVTIESPADGALFNFGDTVPFKVTVTDPQDGDIDCSEVTVTYILGHDNHGHPLTSADGCEGTITAPADSEHDPNANIFGVLDAEYTDHGGGDQAPLTSHAQVKLQPRHRQAEHYTAQHGVTPQNHDSANGGRTAGDINDGDWISFTPYNLAGATRLKARISSAGVGGTLEIRTGSATGTLIGSAEVPVTGGWENFQDVETALNGVPAGTTDLYLVAKGGPGALYDIDDFEITGGPAPVEDTSRVLVFSKTQGFRHDAIPDGIAALRELGAQNGIAVDATEDAGWFTTDGLRQYDAVVFLSTTGDVLDDIQQAAFEQYIADGGGYLGVHAAADTEYDWPFYGELVGAWFDSHPAIQEATVRIEDHDHPATAHLDDVWNRTDEWYNYRTDPREKAHVLATLDETTYDGGSMNGDHPISWCQDFRGGRSFYTGLGHTKESYTEDAFLDHLLGGLQYATGQKEADCAPEAGYRDLFDGHSLDGWKQAGPGRFTIQDGTLNSEGGMGLLWYEDQRFSSYSLKLDWKMTGDDNSGVFVGFPASDDPNSAVDNGYEIQIDATDVPERTTGAIYSFQSADTEARDHALNPPGEWNSYEIRVEGERIQVFLNEVKINDFTNTDPVRSLTDGHVGLQNHSSDDQVAFRNIQIRELPATGA